MPTATGLLLTMSEIASLARVRRPVVSVWRARSAGSEHPFPSPVSQRGSQLMFDADQVTSWLELTGKGNNDTPNADVAAHASQPETAPLDVLTALLALRASTGRPLADRSRDDLLDDADAADPDDSAFFHELDDASDLMSAARYVDDVVDAAYGEAPAFERLLDLDRRTFSAATPGMVFTAVGARLIASIARGLASAHSAETLPALVGSSDAGDVIIELARIEKFADTVVTLSRNDDDLGSRMFRRRLLAHRIRHTELLHESVSGPVLRLAVFGGEPGTASLILDTVDDIAVTLGEEQCALVVAPSSVLCDGGLDLAADVVRSGIIRSGQVRAVLRLPAGLRAGMSRQSLTVWVLGAAHPAVAHTDRWTMIADLSAVSDIAVVDGDLVGDVVASLGDYRSIRAHAFRFATPVFTRQLLARRGSLVQAASGGPLRENFSAPVEETIQVERLIDELGFGGLLVAPSPPDRAVTPRVVSVARRFELRQLRYFPGNRLPGGLVDEVPAGAGRVTVIGAGEVLGERPVGSRTVDRLRFVVGHPSGRLSEPGDVIFVTSPRPRAIVDHSGLSVVLFPARIFRILPGGDDRLVAEVLAADVNARPASDTAWRTWMCRGVAASDRAPVVDALSLIRGERDAARSRMVLLEELEGALIASVTRGGLTVTATSGSAHPASLALLSPDSPAPPAKGLR